jgi:hypothetical protein
MLFRIFSALRICKNISKTFWLSASIWLVFKRSFKKNGRDKSSQTYAPKKPKGFSLGLDFQFLGIRVLGLGLGLGLGILQIFCRFRIRLLKIKKKF